MRLKKLHFSIVGAQKCGTSFLYEQIRLQPSFNLPKKKEQHFFDAKTYDNWRKIKELKYSLKIQTFGKGLIGDATPAYIYIDNALERLYSFNPDVKIICVLRNPVNRAYSAWNMKKSKGQEEKPFHEAIKTELGLYQLRRNEKRRRRVYIDRGRYEFQILRAKSIFPPEHILWIKSEEMWSDLDSTIESVCQFMGVPFVKHQNSTATNVGAYETRISRVEWNLVYEQLKKDIYSTEKILGWDCSDWHEMPPHLMDQEENLD